MERSHMAAENNGEQWRMLRMKFYVTRDTCVVVRFFTRYWLVDCPKSGPGPGGPRSRPDQTPNVQVQVQLVSGLDLGSSPGLDPNQTSL